MRSPPTGALTYTTVCNLLLSHCLHLLSLRTIPHLLRHVLEDRECDCLQLGVHELVVNFHLERASCCAFLARDVCRRALILEISLKFAALFREIANAAKKHAE